MGSYSQDIQLYAAELSLGENKRVLCPACQGGSSSEKSLSITLCEDGVLKWQCFRSKCDLKEGSASHNYTLQVQDAAAKRSRRVFEGQTHELRQRDKDWIAVNWGITDPSHWYYTSEMGGRIAMSVRSPKFLHRGWVLRDIKGTSRTKALTYIDEGEQGMSWYKTHPNRGTLVVEDIPSAVRASKYMNSVALLGTGIGLDRALEISEYAPRPIVMALDQDATALSFKWARKHALLWGDVEVQVLEKDIKDMTETELKQLIGE